MAPLVIALSLTAAALAGIAMTRTKDEAFHGEEFAASVRSADGLVVYAKADPGSLILDHVKQGESVAVLATGYEPPGAPPHADWAFLPQDYWKVRTLRGTVGFVLGSESGRLNVGL